MKKANNQENKQENKQSKNCGSSKSTKNCK